MAGSLEGEYLAYIQKVVGSSPTLPIGVNEEPEPGRSRPSRVIIYSTYIRAEELVGYLMPREPKGTPTLTT